MSLVRLTGRILLVDDDLQSLDATRRILEISGIEVTTAVNGHDALEKVRGGVRADVVITDLRMPKMEGIEFLRALRLLGDSTPVILMTAFGTVEDAVEAMKLGAVDFLSKPFRRQALIEAVQVALQRAHAAQKISQVRAAGGIASDAESRLLIGHSEAMRKLRDQIARVAQTQATVLISGESGTGKELVARMLADMSPRVRGPWVAVNCAALPENLLESELFGHEKGAFSGATQMKKGLFETAHQGTLFLDEIGDMPIALQAKLLRVLQEGEIRRVGSTQTIPIDVRVIAASHQPLNERVLEGRFRQDLLFRLQVVSLEVPALRDRVEDIPALAQFFVSDFSVRHGKESVGLGVDVLDALRSHTWPGNVRELSNAIERALVFSTGTEIELQDLPPHLAGGAVKPGTLGSIEVRLGTPLREIEDLLIQKTLDATEGDKQMTARLLGINERTIYRRLKDGPAQG